MHGKKNQPKSNQIKSKQEICFGPVYLDHYSHRVYYVQSGIISYIL